MQQGKEFISQQNQVMAKPVSLEAIYPEMKEKEEKMLQKSEKEKDIENTIEWLRHRKIREEEKRIENMLREKN